MDEGGGNGTGAGKGQYFSSPPPRRYFSTGCTLLDCVLGGGLVVGRILNVVGDKSTGKTLVCIESSANFLQTYPDGLVEYRESEAAFDEPYAATVGLPSDHPNFALNPPKGEIIDTVEEAFEALGKFCDRCEKRGVPGLWILDSLDALSDAAEMKTKMGDGTYGMGKARQMSQLFRRRVRQMERVGVAAIIVSQVRDNIGVTFGRKTKRSGGRALDFYASQVLFLAQKGKIRKTRENIVRAVGVNIVVNCDKNKIGPPHRECEFPILFSYGMDDITAGLDWLETVGGLGEAIGTVSRKAFEKELRAMPPAEYKRARELFNKGLRRKWAEVEKLFENKRRKY